MSQIQVQYEATPNPNSMKFKFNLRLTDSPLEISSARESESSPLAQKIFGFPWATAVYIGEDFVTVSKADWVGWDILSEPLAGLLKEHLEQGLPLFADIAPETDEESAENDSEVVKKIKHVIKTEIRPVVSLDDGDVVFGKFEEGLLYIHMKGSCSGCPSSTQTLKQGIEVRMRELIPEIKEVLAL